MNQRQQKVMYWAVAVMVVMLIFPPLTEHGWHGRVFNCGYGFLLSLPNSCTVYLGLLLVQLFMAAIVGWIFWFRYRDKQ